MSLARRTVGHDLDKISSRVSTFGIWARIPSPFQFLREDGSISFTVLETKFTFQGELSRIYWVKPRKIPRADSTARSKKTATSGHFKGIRD